MDMVENPIDLKWKYKFISKGNMTKYHWSWQGFGRLFKNDMREKLYPKLTGIPRAVDIPSYQSYRVLASSWL
jgi:hypothetical protein